MKRRPILLDDVDSLQMLRPIQLLGATRVLTNEQQLYLAILEEALSCLQGRATEMPDKSGRKRQQRRRRRIMYETEFWVRDRTQYAYGISFLDCCTALKLDPDIIGPAMLARRTVVPTMQQYVAEQVAGEWQEAA